jgi:hypothetical protein
VFPSEFVFAMRVAGRDRLDGMLGEVAETVFRNLGLSAPAVADLTAQLNALLSADALGESEVDVQFTARRGSCEVVVLTGTRKIWHETIPTS